MKKEANTFPAIWPVPKTIVSVRDMDGRNSALVVGFAANIGIDPPMVMVAIDPARFSYHMIKENPCFVINFPGKNFHKEYDYLGFQSNWDEDKFAALNLKTEEASHVNAAILSDCPVSVECSVVESYLPGSHELFVGKVEAIHCDEEYLDENGNILWDKLELL